MDRDEKIARLRRAKSIVNNIAVAGKNTWQALLLATADLEAVEEALTNEPDPAEDTEAEVEEE